MTVFWLLQSRGMEEERSGCFAHVNYGYNADNARIALKSVLLAIEP